MHAKLYASGVALLAAAAACQGLPSADQATPAPVAAPTVAQAPPPFVPSMAGTQADGRLRQSGDRLQVDAELRHLFDYYLSALGETSLPAIRAGIERDLQQRLAPQAAAQALALLDQYLAYKRALADAEQALPQSGSPAAGARARLQAMQALRQRYFSAADAAALFGDSDARDLDAIARLELAQDRSLDAAQREERRKQLDARLPPAILAEREAPRRILLLEEQVSAARARGAGDDEIYRLRAAALSQPAAARLAELDREQTDWLRRIALYQSGRQQLQGAGGGAPAALQQLRDSLFNAQEQKRLGAYE